MVVNENHAAPTGELAKIERRVERLAKELVALGQADVDWAYHPPQSDEPKDWTGLLRFCYVDRAYRWSIDRARLLKNGGGPYCLAHGEQRPATGGQARNCWPCEWEATEYDICLALAREIGRWQASAKLTGQAPANARLFEGLGTGVA